LFRLDKAEPDEDPEVTRAKYFIRDEFLVSTPANRSIDEDHFVFSESAQLPVKIVIIVTHTSLVRSTRKIFVECSTIAATLFNVCT
jgi:hypothetical protein